MRPANPVGVFSLIDMKRLKCFHVARILPGQVDVSTSKAPLGKHAIEDTGTRTSSSGKAVYVPTVDDIRRASRIENTYHNFLTIFGKSGVAIILVVVISIVWTVWLIVLTVLPNDIANYLTETTEFDNGQFWMIIDPDPTFLTISVVSLAVLVFIYIDVLLKMTLHRHFVQSASPFKWLTAMMCPGRRVQSRFEQNTLNFWYELTAFDGKRRKYWNALLKLPDLLIEIAALYRLLEDGVPASLCYAYAGLIAANSLSCAMLIMHPEHRSAFSEVFVDSFFDMVFAVAWPILWLVFSVRYFEFDRAKALLYLKVYPTGWFERKARLMADASKVTLFQISFDALRMKSGPDLCLRMAMNLSFCYRLKRAVEYSILRRRRAINRSGSAKVIKAVKQLNLPRPVAIVFVLVSTGVLVVTHMSILTSGDACAAYSQCAAYAYRWKEHEFCPCRALIDVETGPRTYDQWTHPPDATSRVKTLASTGDLRIIQIINRQLPVWPEELQRCTDLRSITLLYTNIAVVPTWAASFTKLEMLSIEGRPIDNNLVSLPDNLFDDMSKLTYLHFAVHQSLTELPPMNGLTNLKSLTLAVMLSLKNLPQLDMLTKLQMVQAFGDVLTERIPNLSPHVSAVNLIVMDSQACCNGYIVCNPTHYLCASHPICLDKTSRENRPNEVTQRLFDLITVQSCQSHGFKTSDFFVSPSKQDVDNCGGILYAACQKFNGSVNVPGMCYNERMQVVACQTMPLRTIARKQEIQLGIGTPCDPAHEKWLGCGV